MNKNILERALNKNLENWGNAITTVTGANIVSAHFNLYLPSAQWYPTKSNETWDPTLGLLVFL